MSATVAAVVGFDPLKDKSYQSTRLGRDVADFLAWLELGGSSPRTLDQYERDLSRGAKMFPTKGIADITDGDAIQIARSFKTGERRVRVAAWRSFYKWARGQRLITVNPFDALPTIKRAPKKVYDIFTDPEIEALCSLATRDATLMRIMVDAGPRKGDCRAFELRHFRTAPTLTAPYGTLVFHEGKGGNDRQVPATQAVAQAIADLELLERLRPDDHLWYGERANAVARRQVRAGLIGEGTFARWWRRCLTDAGVRYRNPHMTRHTFATRWLRRGGRLETLSVAMGHSSIKTTFDLYGHLDTRDVGADMLLMAEANL
jgi:integrase